MQHNIRNHCYNNSRRCSFSLPVTSERRSSSRMVVNNNTNINNNNVSTVVQFYLQNVQQTIIQHIYKIQHKINNIAHSIQGRPQDLGGGAKNIFFRIWEFACREATCCAWQAMRIAGACPGGGPGRPPPPLEIKKQKKKVKSEQILSYFTYILLLFQSKILFSQLVSELGPPPPEKLKSKKKKKKKCLSDFGPPLLRIPGHAPALLGGSGACSHKKKF